MQSDTPQEVRDRASNGVEVKGKTLVPGGHLWATLEDGSIDYYRYESDPHAGPMCVLCRRAPCVNCKDPMDGLCPKNQEVTLPGLEYT